MAANPQVENGFIRIANEIWDELIRRDFTKRQKDIMQFIWRLSYGCRKKSAKVPLLKDFAMCGVLPSHISTELRYLEQCKVITWDRSTNTFEVNKNYDSWQVNPVKGWDEKRFRELIHENISQDSTYQNGESDLPKQEVYTYQKGKSDLPKQEVEEGSNPCGSKAEDVSKDSIKDSIKDITPTIIKEPDEIFPETDPLIVVQDAYCELHQRFPFHLTQKEIGSFKKVLAFGIPPPFISKTMIEMYQAKKMREGDQFKIPGSFRYYESGIIAAWELEQAKQEGGASEYASQNGGVSRYGETAGKGQSQPSITDDELDQLNEQSARMLDLQ